MFKRMRDLASGIRTLSVTVDGGTTRLGVNLKDGAEIGVVNKYNVEFNNGSNEPILNCLDCNIVERVVLKKAIKKMDTHINALLEKKGYFTRW